MKGRPEFLPGPVPLSLASESDSSESVTVLNSSRVESIRVRQFIEDLNTYDVRASTEACWLGYKLREAKAGDKL